MKKILLISNMYPSDKYKHYGVFVQNTENLLRNSGYHVDVSALTKKDSKLTKLIGYSLFYLKAILLVITHNYDILYVHYISHCALLVKIIKKIKPNIKLVINVHGNDVVPEDKHDEEFIPLVKQIMPMVDRCIVPSKYFQQIMINEYHLSNDIVKVFPSGGVNLEVFKPRDKDEKIRIGYIGRYEIKKGWEVFLKAISLLNRKDIEIVMVGTGNEEHKVDKMIEEYNLKVIKYPMLNQKDLAKLYASLDIFIFPTYRKSESLGLVGLEAMACGAITIASNMAGPTSYIKDGINGFLFVPKDEIDLKNKLKYVLSLNNYEKNKIRDEALKTVKEYDVNNISKILLEIFNEI